MKKEFTVEKLKRKLQYPRTCPGRFHCQKHTFALKYPITSEKFSPFFEKGSERSTFCGKMALEKNTRESDLKTEKRMGDIEKIDKQILEYFSMVAFHFFLSPEKKFCKRRSPHYVEYLGKWIGPVSCVHFCPVFPCEGPQHKKHGASFKACIHPEAKRERIKYPLGSNGMVLSTATLPDFNIVFTMPGSYH